MKDEQDKTPPAPLHFSSVGYLGMCWGVDPYLIQRAAGRLKLRPALTLNGVEHYDPPAIAQLMDEVNPSDDDLARGYKALGITTSRDFPKPGGERE